MRIPFAIRPWPSSSIGLAVLLSLALAGGPLLAQAPSDQEFGWLRNYVNQPTRKLVADPLFSALLQLVVPPYPVIMDRDRGLPAALATQFQHSGHRVRLHDDRYLNFSGYRTDGGVSQSFLWFDLQRDLAVGAVYMRLGGRDQLLFFIQPQRDVQETSAFPQPFLADLQDWQRQAKLPLLLPLHFADSGGRDRVLVHTPDDCTGLSQGSNKEIAACLALNRNAAELDLDEAFHVADRRLEPPAARALQTGQAAWLAQRDSQCSAAPADVDCRTRAAYRRALALAQSAATASAAVALRSAATPPTAGDRSGFRDADAGLQFIAPPGWDTSSDASGVLLTSPDSQATIEVWTSTDTSFDSAMRDLVAQICGKLDACNTDGPLRPDRVNNLAAETIAGTAERAGAAANWTADLLRARLPVVVLYLGTPGAMIEHAADIGAFRASLRTLN